MRKLLILLACLFFITIGANAQTATVKGVINDTINKVNLENSSVALLRAKDSVLYKFTRSNKTGAFEFKNVTPGKYILMVTQATFADYFDQLEVKSEPETQLGQIAMTLQARLLENVTVRQTLAAMRMKGDTLEYRADSFKVRQGASVEELLKTLPGIQVDKDGKITAQGEKIEKVLVDGEEFFGDDPTIATRGLQADALERVQVFDKKSDQATFSGIDDGQRTKTLNLKLKDDKKKGYFGKLDLSGGTNDRWTNSAMFNAFKGKRKFSAYGIMSSTGKTGLDWQEQNNYGSSGSMDMQMTGDGGIMISGGGEDDFGGGTYYGQGIPKSWTGALNYTNKSANDKQTVNGSYRYSKVNTEGYLNTLTQTITPGSVFFTDSRGTFNTSRFKNSVNGSYDVQLDSFTSVKFTGRGSKGKSESFNRNETASTNALGNFVNKGFTSNSVFSDNEDYNISMILRKRFRKAGRTISLNVSNQYNNANTTGNLFSSNDYFTSVGAFDHRDTTDQRKVSAGRTNAVNGTLVFTEPLSKKVFLELSYGLRYSDNNSERLSYNQDVVGKYSVFDTAFSNSYNYKFLINTEGANVRYNGKKLTIGVGSDVAQAKFTQLNKITSKTEQQNYTNLFPKANLTYKFSANSRLNFNYNGYTNQPSITQLQPVKDNSNPLYVGIGNPDLKQEFTQNARVSYYSYKVLSQSSFNISLSYRTTSNAISKSETIDQSFKRTYQYINVDGNYNASMYSGYGLKIKKLDAYFNFGLNYSHSRYVSFSNGKKNITDNQYPGINMGFNKGKEKKYSFNLWGNWSFNHSKSSLNPDFVTKYWTVNVNPSLNIQLPYKFEINTDAQLNIRQKTKTFANNDNVYFVNAFIGRKLMKNDQAMIKLVGYDLLDQNQGFTRRESVNTVTQSDYQVLKRYFALNFVWNFSKTPAGMGPTKF
jgi:hypothetical protein